MRREYPEPFPSHRLCSQPGSLTRAQNVLYSISRLVQLTIANWSNGDWIHWRINALPQHSKLKKSAWDIGRKTWFAWDCTHLTYTIKWWFMVQRWGYIIAMMWSLCIQIYVKRWYVVKTTEIMWYKSYIQLTIDFHIFFLFHFQNSTKYWLNINVLQNICRPCFPTLQM